MRLRVPLRALPLVLVVTALPLIAMCQGRLPPPPPPPPAPPLDTVLGPGQVVCGKVTKQSELIGGPGAYGEVGRAYRCHNARIRFIVQDASRPVGISVEGGNLIDVDRVRPDELVDGHDTFREHVSAVGAKEIRVESIDVAADGSAGVGIIRVKGTPTDLTLAPQAYYLGQNLVGELVTEYILRPDVDYIEIKTTFLNLSGQPTLVQPADFVALGGTTIPHTPELGFGDVDLFTEVSWLSSTRAAHVSYALVAAESDMTIPYLEQGITAPFMGPSVTVGSERDFIRWLVVGDGTLESTTRTIMELKALPSGTARGNVVVDGAAVTGVLVSALVGASLDDEDARVVNETRANADGTWSLTLPPGEYFIVAHAPGLFLSEPQAGVVVADGAGVDVADLTVAAAGAVDVTTRFVDRSGADLGARAAKLTLVPRTDQGTRSPLRVLRELSAQGASTYAYAADGAFHVEIAPGAYTAYVTRGFEFTRFEQQIDVVAGAALAISAELVHVLDTTGLVGGEFHQHTLGSIDAQVPVPEKVLENAAEGIEVAASTDHDVVTNFAPHVEALGLTAQLRVFPGSEVSYQGIGHFNAYPWDVDDADPFAGNGARFWWLKTVPEMFRDVRAAAGDPLIQINHPRSQTTGYFTSALLNPVDATLIPREPPGIPTFPATIYEDWAGDFDSMEVNGSLGSVNNFTPEGLLQLAQDAQNGDVPNFADYLALLGAGMTIVAMGNSDTHGLDEGTGYPRNFLDVGTDDPTLVDEALLRETIRAQRNSVGEGCLLEIYADGNRAQGRARMVQPSASLSVKLQAPPHVAPGALAVYVNGIVRPYVFDAGALRLEDVAGALSRPVSDAAASGAANLDDIVRVDGALEDLPLGEGDLIVLVASKDGSGLAPTGGGQALCYSAPLYVDVDGDGAHTPWLAGTQQVLP